MAYKMERQQLRNDARMAQQKLGEKNRIDAMFENIRGNQAGEPLPGPAEGKNGGWMQNPDQVDHRVEPDALERIQKIRKLQAKTQMQWTKFPMDGVLSDRTENANEQILSETADQHEPQKESSEAADEYLARSLQGLNN